MDNLKNTCHFGYSCGFQGFFDEKSNQKQSDTIYLVLTYLNVKTKNVIKKPAECRLERGNISTNRTKNKALLIRAVEFMNHILICLFCRYHADYFAQDFYLSQVVNDNIFHGTISWF